MSRSAIKGKTIAAILLLSSAVTVSLCVLPSHGGAEEPEYNPRGRRDPFVPLVGVIDAGSGSGVGEIMTIEDISFQGIVIDPDGKKGVIINGEMIKEGEARERLFVESVGSNTVTIKLDEERHELKLYE